MLPLVNFNMPELPEVETLRRELEPALKNKIIEEIRVLQPGAVKPLSAKEFINRNRNRKISELRREGKILMIFFTDQDGLLIHLKMTGQIIYRANNKEPVIGGHPQPGGAEDLPNSYTAIEWHFTDGSTLYFNDSRKFGWIYYSKQPEKENVVQKLGVGPLDPDFTVEILLEFINKYPRRNIKQLIMDQELIAGVGNIYADEALFQAGIRPDKKVNEITESETAKLHSALKKVLEHSVQKGGTSFRDYKRSNGEPGGFVPYLKVYGREGEPCSNCGRAVKKIRLNNRGTHYCIKCQK